MTALMDVQSNVFCTRSDTRGLWIDDYTSVYKQEFVKCFANACCEKVRDIACIFVRKDICKLGHRQEAGQMSEGTQIGRLRHLLRVLN